MVQQYAKPHLAYAEQLQLLKSRGMSCGDDGAAEDVLRAAGYYRLSAYVYPFRQMLDAGAERSSPANFRSETLRPGTTFEQIESLWRFDRKLRMLCSDALATIEVGIRTHIAHVLGARDTFGHLQRQSLDEVQCSKVVALTAGAMPNMDAFEVWLARYEKLKGQAVSEDFVRHNVYKYGKNLPI